MYITCAIGCDSSWNIYKGILINTSALMQTRYEPCHDIMFFFVLHTLMFQTRMLSHPVGLDVWFLVRPFIYFHNLCVRTAKALARLCICAGSPEPSLVAYMISTIISHIAQIIRAASWQNQQNECAPSEDSDQPGHPPSLISLRCALNG